MDHREKELTAYCGLYCGDCVRYRSKAADFSRALLSELRDTQFDKYAEYKSSSAKQFNPMKQFENYRKCCEVLEAIVELQCNTPCRLGMGCPTFSCDILKCCQNQGYQGCWECNEFEGCAKFEKLRGCHGDGPQQNLKKIKEMGLDKWTEHRCKPYVWL